MNADPRSVWSRFPVGLEEGVDGSVAVHALTLPGCVGSGSSRDEALEAFGSVLGEWLTFLEQRGEPVPPRDRELEIVVEEWIATEAWIGRGQSVACFEADRAPLTAAEARAGLARLGELRARLLPLVRRARNADLEARGTPEYNARLVLDELARAQWWALTRLGASPLATVPEHVVARLDTAMALVVHHLAHLEDGARDRCLEIDGEWWTPRKVLRRLLWLEWALGGSALDLLRSR